MRLKFLFTSRGLSAAIIACGWMSYTLLSLAGQTYFVNDVLHTLLCERGTLNVHDRVELARETFTLLACDRPLFLPLEFFHHLGIVAQICLRAHDEARHTRAVVMDLWDPFLRHVLERRWRCHAEAHEKNVRTRVREWAQTVVVLLACTQAQLTAHASRTRRKAHRRCRTGRGYTALL
jgi:hypothetical protein